MRLKSKIMAVILGLGLIFLFVVAGCSSAGDEDGSDPEQPDGEAFTPPTAEAAPSVDGVPSPTIAQLTDAQPRPTETEAATEKSQPESRPIAPTPAVAVAVLEPEVIAQAKTNLNLRRGPGTSYDIVGRLSAGGEVTVIGRLEDDSWLLVEHEAGQAWLVNDPELVTVNQELLAQLPTVETPLLVYDPNNENVNRLLNQIPLVVYHDGFHTCASHGGLNNLFDVANGNVIGPHSGDFVMGHDNVLFEYSNGGVRLIQENPIARFENGEKYLSFEEAMQLFARNEILWTGSFGEWPARGVTGCDPAASP
jgi:hypothetical protein